MKTDRSVSAAEVRFGGVPSDIELERLGDDVISRPGQRSFLEAHMGRFSLLAALVLILASAASAIGAVPAIRYCEPAG